AAEIINKANRINNVTSHINNAIVKIKDKKELLEEVCKIAVSYGDFEMSWVGLVEESSKDLIKYASAGDVNDYLKEVGGFTIDVSKPKGNGPTATSLRRRVPITCNDIANDVMMQDWKAIALQNNFKSLIALPIKVKDDIIGAFTLYSSIINFFNEEEIKLLVNVTNNIGFAIDAIETENERQEAIIALIESEGRYKTFFDDNSSIMILVDPASGEIRDANPAACNFYGWEKAELCSMNIKDVNLISDEDVVSNMQSIKVGDKKHFVVKHILANCDIKDVEVYSGLITYNNEKLLFSIIHDITDRRIIEEKLVASEELWRSIIKTTPDGMSITALDGTLQFVSDNLVKWYGYDSADDFIGKKAFEFLVPTSVKFAEERLVRMLNGEIKNSAVYELLRKDGSTFFVEVNAEFMRNKDGIPKSILLIERDITDRIIVEESLRKLSRAVEQSPVITYITNINGEIEYVNPKTLEITGYSKEELIGMNPRIFSSGLNSKDMYSDLFHTVKSGKQWEGEFYNKKKNGELFYVKAIITPIINEEGNTTNYLAIQNDITIQKQAENDLKESEATLNYAQEIANMGSWNYNLKSNEASWSKNYYQLLGIDTSLPPLSLEEIKTMVHPDDRNLFEDKIVDLISTHSMGTIIFRLLKPDSTIKWIQTNMVPEFRENELAVINGVSIDITDKKITEEQLYELNTNLELIVQERTEELAQTNEYLQKEIEGRKKISQALNEAYDRLYKIADRIPGVVYQYQLNPDGTSSFPFSSKGIYDIYQVTPEEVSVDASLVMARLHPEDYDEVIASITKSAKDQELWRHEYRVKFEDGTVRWLLGNAMPQLEPDGSVLWHGFISDITEQKESENKLIEIEKRFSLFMDNLPAIVFMKDSESRLLYTNTAMDIALGASKWIGLESDEIFGSEESARIKADDQLTIQLGYQEIKESFYNLDGEIHYYETQKFAIPIKGQLPLIGAVAIDITQRTKIEEELKKIEQSYQTVVENVNEVIFQTDTEGLWVFLNKSWEVITGFSAGESLGQLFLNYVHPDDRQRNMELFEPLIKREKDYCRHEIRYLTKDGGFRWIEVYARLGLNAKNEITGTYGTLQDITERRKKEEELKQLSTRLSLATHSGGIGVWDFDIENDILVWDDQMYALYGITSTEFSGAYDAWQNGLHPDDKEQGDIEIKMAISGEKDFDTEFRVVWPDGTIRYVKANAIVQKDESGKVVNLVGTNWDITDQKKSENALMESEASHLSMITNISDVIGVIGIDGVMKYKSPNIEKYFGWKPEDLVGFDGWHTVHPDDLERISKEFGELIKEDNNAKTVEYRYKCKDGSYKPIELTATNLVNDKIINGVLLNYHDITDRKEAENLLEQTRQNYETFFNTIDDFLWVLDEQGNIIHANSTVKTRLEYPAEELMNKSVLLVHPTDRREEAGRIVGEMLRGEAEFCPVPIVTKSNKQIPVQTRVKPGFWNGQSVIFGVSKDVSKIQLSEQKFSSAFQANAAMMAISHFKQGIYFDVNNAFTEVMGYTYDEIIGKTNKEYSLFVDPNLREEILNKLDNKIPVRKMEIQMRTKDGTIKTG
ncbi:MAG: PAS domain S-box protein, partial [Bacteroidota bacterium]